MHHMRLFLSILWVLLIFQVRADVPDGQAAEVEHLINYMARSHCHLVRNGKSYNGKDGANHVRRKYDHFRKEISSTEEFIGYAASKSTMSGEFYLVECPDQEPVRSEDWLLEELKAYREQ